MALNTEKISNISNVFIIFLLKTLQLENVNFLDAVCGFIYASKKVMKALEVLGLITDQQLVEIENQLSKAAIEDIPKSSILEQLKKFINKEEKDG